ncbi:MAG: Bax inhibitor-1/YccA family protein [Flavobacteriales bacterium]|nr:Bax inhibitor-1/YccA family protein [Flavobacteriales bacterium]
MNLEEFNQQTIDLESKSVSKSFVTNVFSWMTLALVISGVTAWWFASSGLIVNILTGSKILFWLIMLAPLGMVMLMSFSLNKLSVAALTGLFIAYSAVNGISLSTIFLAYAAASIAKVFFITAGLFVTMAAIGYTTNTDLTKLGSLLMMALIGIIIASLVNMFMGSEKLDYIISCIGVLVFTGLIAYDTQKIKRIGAGVEYGSATAGKLAIMGALSLYLDFINLFIFLLRIFGGRKD